MTSPLSPAAHAVLAMERCASSHRAAPYTACIGCMTEAIEAAVKEQRAGWDADRAYLTGRAR